VQSSFFLNFPVSKFETKINCGCRYLDAIPTNDVVAQKGVNSTLAVVIVKTVIIP
jgi:hypothetical protein